MKITNKKLVDIMDNITERKMKRIIIVCIFICLFCEFVPDMIDICKLFNYCKIVVFLQPHKDFFTNIALGCLGSAVISYIILYIQLKVKEEQKKEKSILCYDDILSKYHQVFYWINTLANYEEIEGVEESDIEYIKKFIKSSNAAMKNSIKKILNSDEIFKDNICEKNLYNIITQELYSISFEIEEFLQVLNFYNFTDENKVFQLKLEKEIYKNLYSFLQEKYRLKELDKKIVDLTMSPDILSIILENKTQMDVRPIQDINQFFEYISMINKTIRNMPKNL